LIYLSTITGLSVDERSVPMLVLFLCAETPVKLRL